MSPFFLALAATLGLTATAFAPARAQDVMSDHVRTFAVLPDGVRFPEGIAANPANGDIYVGTFDFAARTKATMPPRAEAVRRGRRRWSWRWPLVRRAA